MLLRSLAHARTGDKGTLVTISLIAFDIRDYPILEEQVTAERVTELFSEFVDRPVTRYTLPSLGALNFVLSRPVTAGVTRSLALDAHGKCLGFALLGMDVRPEAKKAAGQGAQGGAEPVQGTERTKSTHRRKEF